MAAPHSSDERVSAEQVLAHRDLVEQIARRVMGHGLGPQVELEDLIADGAVGLVEAAHRFRPNSTASFRTFASWRVHGAIVDGLRRTAGRKRERLIYDQFDPITHEQPSSTSPADAVCAQRSEVARLLATVPARERLILRRYYCDEKPDREIGQELGLSTGRVNQLRSRALQRLRGVAREA